MLLKATIVSITY